MNDERIAAVVTGAASGIGAATVRRLVQEGWHVECLDRDARGLADLTGELGDRVAVREIDLAEPRQLDAYLRSRAGTRVDRVAFCAGVHAVTPVAGIDLDAAERLMRTNLGATVRLLGGLAPALAVAPAPRVVVVSSVHARHVERGSAVYAISKAGLESFVRSAAVELAAEGILVNAVTPGFVDTLMALLPDGVPEHESEAFQQVYLRHGRLPLGRSARAEEIAAAIHFLLSEENTYITGHSLVVDGGLTAGF